MIFMMLFFLACGDPPDSTDPKNQPQVTDDTNVETTTEDETSSDTGTTTDTETAAISSISVSPSSLLLNGLSDSAELTIKAYAEDGTEIEDATFSFDYQNADIASVSETATVTPIAIGLTALVVRSGDVESTSIPILVTPETADLQVLEDDVEVVVAAENSDPWAGISSESELTAMTEEEAKALDRLNVTLDSSITAADGQVMLIKSAAMYAKVISSQDNADGTQTLLVEEMGLSEVYPNFEFAGKFDLTVQPREEMLDAFDVTQEDGTFVFTPKSQEATRALGIKCASSTGVSVNLSELATIDNMRIAMIDENGQAVGAVDQAVEVRHLPNEEKYVITTPFLQNYQYQISMDLRHNVSVQGSYSCKFNALEFVPGANIVALLVGIVNEVAEYTDTNFGMDFGVGASFDISAAGSLSVSYTEEIRVSVGNANGLAINEDVYESCSTRSTVRCGWNLATETAPFESYGEDAPSIEIVDWKTRNFDANGELAMQVFLGVYAEFIIGGAKCRGESSEIVYPRICIKLVDLKAGAQADFQIDLSMENQLNERNERDGIELQLMYSLSLGEFAANVNPTVGFQVSPLLQFADSVTLTGTPTGSLSLPTSGLPAGALEEADYVAPYIEWSAQSDGDIEGWIAGLSSLNEIQLYAYNFSTDNWDLVHQTEAPALVAAADKVQTHFDIDHETFNQLLSDAKYTDDFSQYVQFAAAFKKMGNSWEIANDSIVEHYFTCPGLFAAGVDISGANIEELGAANWSSSGNFYPAIGSASIESHGVFASDSSMILQAGNDGVLGSGGNGSPNATYGFGRFPLDIPEVEVDCVTVSFAYQVVTAKAGYYHPYFDLSAQQFCTDNLSDENATYSPNIYMEFQTYTDAYESIGTIGDFPLEPAEYFCSNIIGETSNYAYTDWLQAQFNIPVQELSTLNNVNFFMNVYGGYGDHAHWVFFDKLQIKQCDTCLQ